MERDPFEPRGERAEWRIVYDRLKTLAIDQVISYETLSELLGRPFRDDRAPLYRAMRELETQDKRTLENVRCRGYRVVHPTEHEKLATAHVRKSHRQLTKAKGRVDSADRTGLDQETRRRLDAKSVNLGAVHQMVLRLNRKVSEHDEELAKIRSRVKTDRRENQEDLAALSERVDAVAALLERHGITASEQQVTG